jgi:regulator of sirC expression with transglutaminase-like and TPR domain
LEPHIPSDSGGTRAPHAPTSAIRGRRAHGDGPHGTAAGRASSLSALLELLDDDSPTVVAAVRRELEHGGGSAVEHALERAAHGAEARLRIRARDVLAARRRRSVLRRLMRHGARSRIRLEPALFLMAGLSTDRFDARPYRRALDAMALEVRRRLDRETDPSARALVLPHYLGQELGYAGSEDDYHHPDNIHIHRVIERRAGMPLSLSAIYLFVARRVGLRAGMIPLPGHVLLRLHHGERSFLVDPFQGGRVRSRADCLGYLRECDLVPQPEWFDEADDGAMFLRHVMNLVNSYRMRGLSRRARELQAVAGLLARVQARRHRPALLD